MMANVLVSWLTVLAIVKGFIADINCTSRFVTGAVFIKSYLQKSRFSHVDRKPVIEPVGI